MKLPKRVTICEVGTRDGFQIEPEFVPTDQKIEVVNQLSATGMPRIEVTSFVSPKAVPMLKDAEAVMAGITRRPGTRYAALVPNDKGAVRAVDAGVDDIHTVVSASESHNLANVNMTIAESLAKLEAAAQVAQRGGKPVYAGISCSFGCPFEGDVPVAQLASIVERLVGFGARGHRPRRHHGDGQSRAGRARARARDAPLPRRRVDDPHARHAGDGHPEHPVRDGAGRDALRRLHRRPRRLSRSRPAPPAMCARRISSTAWPPWAWRRASISTRSSRPPGASSRSSAARCRARS